MLKNRINHMTQPKKGFSEKFVSGIKSTSHYFNYVWYVLVSRNVCAEYFSLFSWKDPKGKKAFQHYTNISLSRTVLAAWLFPVLLYFPVCACMCAL